MNLADLEPDRQALALPGLHTKDLVGEARPVLGRRRKALLLVQGQLLIPLLSDPFGWGWNLWGTARYRIDIGIVGARFVWYWSVASIVTGHVVAVVLAHHVALRTFPAPRDALRSQLPMLVLMVAYTMLSLWIIAQPIVEAAPGA